MGGTHFGGKFAGKINPADFLPDSVEADQESGLRSVCGFVDVQGVVDPGNKLGGGPKSGGVGAVEGLEVLIDGGHREDGTLTQGKVFLGVAGVVLGISRRLQVAFEARKNKRLGGNLEPGKLTVLRGIRTRDVQEGLDLVQAGKHGAPES